jgi:hypothetical protein
MNEKEDEVAHPGNSNNTSQAHFIQDSLAIRHRNRTCSIKSTTYSRRIKTCRISSMP